jgi:hypothetical protein
LALLTLVIRGGKILAEEDDGAAIAMRSTPKRTEAPKPSPPPAPLESGSAGTPVVDTAQQPSTPQGVSGDGVVPKPVETAPMIQHSEPKPPPATPAAQEQKAAAQDEPVESAEESTTSSAESTTEEVAGTSTDESVSIDTTIAPAHPSVPGEPIQLEIIAVRDAEVTLVLDGVGLPRKRSLIAGERKSWKADSLFVLTVSDGGAVLLKLDDTYIGSPGTDGENVTNLTVRK